MGTIEPRDGEVPEVKKSKKVLNWLWKTVKKRIPVIEWLPHYQWRKDFVADLMAGITVACIHVPQGMAFALLANVEPILGLYTACFSTFIYCLLGTAHIGSFGPVAVASMLTGEAVAAESGKGYSVAQISSLITFYIGIYYIGAFILRLGVLSTIFTKPFTSGFVAGCAVHIIVKNIKFLLGIQIATYYGLFDLYHNAYNLCSHLGKTNIPTVIVASVVLVLLTLNGLLLKRWVGKCTRVVLPVEAALMLLASGLSYAFNFASMGVQIVGYVPTGFPAVVPLAFSASSLVVLQALIVAIVNYATTVSMTLTFNKSFDPDQDLFALSVANLLCSNIQCITIGNAMMRSTIAVSVGTRTLLSSIISSFLLVWVILFAGPLFEPMPECVLGCIIMTGAFLLMWQRLRDLPAVIRSGWENSLIWAGCFFIVIIVGVPHGLVAGIILSLRQILIQFKQIKAKENFSETLGQGPMTSNAGNSAVKNS